MFGVNPHTTVIIVPDDINEFSMVRPDMRALVHQNMVAMSCDNLRMYVTASTWKAMQESYALTAKASA